MPDFLMKGASTTTAASHLFTINNNATPLSADDAVLWKTQGSVLTDVGSVKAKGLILRLF